MEVCQKLIDAENAIIRIQDRLDSGELVMSDMGVFMKDFSLFMKEWPEVKDKVSKTAEIITAWENLKGFHNTLHFVSGFLKILAVIGASMAAMYALLKGFRW